MQGHRNHYIISGCFWIGLYLALVLAPLFLLIVGPAPAGSGFLWDLSAAVGFAAAAMIAVMFILTARFKRATAPFGIDIIYYFHRQIALVGFLFLLAHPLLLLAADPRLFFIMRSGVSPYHLVAGIAAFLAMAALMVSSLWRKQLGIHYDAWRLWHVGLAILAVVLSVVHIEGVGHYVGTPWKRGLWAAIALSSLLVVLFVRVIKPAQLLRRPYRVTEVIRERGDAWTLVLRPDGHDGVTFAAGQFAWLTLWHSPFALNEHPFSFAGSAENPGELRFTIKELGDFTRRIGTARVGQKAFVDAPYGAFSQERLPAPGYCFIAGGIGIAPIISMLRTLADRGDQRSLQLIYGYSSWDRLTLREDIEALKSRLNLEVVYVLQQAHPGWEGETGLISHELLASRLPADAAAREFFVCGPVPMIEAVEKGLYACRVPLSRIHSELFDMA